MTGETGNGLAAGIPAGAFNLLSDCVHGAKGERLLIVEEPRGGGYYDDEAPRMAAAAARALGMRVYETQAPAGLSDAELAEFVEGLSGFDHVLFFARVGDQLRFSEMRDMPHATMCYALDRGMMESPFGEACHRGMCELKAEIDAAFASAREVRVSCPRGTDYAGHYVGGTGPAEVTLQRFPMLVPRPVPAGGFTGRVALSRFLVGTGNRFYEPYWLPLDHDVFAILEGNRIAGFEGPREIVDAVRAHYLHVAGRFGIEPWFVHSWHPGIHPGCGFAASASENILRWSGSAFGNPRILHFHTCGIYAPGEISWNVVDPTVTLDGVALWEEGVLHPERLPGGGGFLARHPRLARLFAEPCRAIGMGE